MSLCLPCGLTVEQLVAGLKDVETIGLPMLGPEGALLAPLIAALTEDAATLLNAPTATEVLTTAVDAEQAAGDEAENVKFPKP